MILSHYNGKFDFRKFGNEADESLSDLTPETKDLCAFKYFKMKLFDEKTTVKAQNGLEIPIVELIEHTIKVWLAESEEK